MVNYSILVVSCDKNLKLLDIFFKYFKIFFQDKSIQVYLLLEQFNYQYEDINIEVINSSHEKLSWTGRVKEALSKIKTQNILLLLDDYIIESPVNIDMLNYLDDILTKDDKIGMFALTPILMKNKSASLYYNYFYERALFGRYRAVLQCGFWNKKEFESLLNYKENAWSFETFGNIRSFLSDRKYFAISSSLLKPINYNDGKFVIQGKLNKEEVTRLEEKFNDSFNNCGLPSNNGIIIRDDITFIRRVFRRIKIILYYILYYLKFVIKKVRIFLIQN